MFEEKQLDTEGGLSFKAPVTPAQPIDKEMVSLAVSGEGFDFWTSDFAKNYEDLRRRVEVGDNSQMQMAMAKQAQSAVDALIKSKDGSIGSAEDLIALNEQIQDVQQPTKLNWQIQRASKKAIEEIVENAVTDPTKAEAMGEMLKDFNESFRVQQELETAKQAAAQALDKESFLNLLQDVFQSAFLAPTDFINLRDAVDDAFPEDNMMGFAFSAGALDAMDKKFQQMGNEDKITFIRSLVDIALKRDSFLGVQENVLNNAWILDTMVNTLKEHRASDGSILGLQKDTDIGLTLYEALDTYSVVNFGSIAKGLYKSLVSKMFGSPKPRPQFVYIDDWYQKRLQQEQERILGQEPKAGAKSGGRTIDGEAVEVVDDIPLLDAKNSSRQNTGSLFDTTKQSSPSEIGKILDEVPEENFPAVLDSLGITPHQFWERAMPQFTGAIDPTAMPPSFFSPALKDFLEGAERNKVLTFIGYQSERDTQMAKFQADFVNTVGGHGFISRSYKEPPVAGDNQSLGTAVIRFGGSPDHGFENPRQAIALANILKSRGESARILPTEDGYFVETKRTHVASESDTTAWNFDGSPMTIPWSYERKSLHTWSKAVIGAPESTHPQRLVSFAVDSSAEAEKRLLDVLKPYTDLAKSIRGRKDFRLVKQAIEESVENDVAFTAKELREQFPEMTQKGRDAYQSYGDFYEAIRFQRSEQARRGLAKRGMKMMQQGDQGFFGRVVDRPKYSGKQTNGLGRPVTDSEDSTIFGENIINRATGEVYPLSQKWLDESYEKGLRVIKFSEPYSVDGGTYTHGVVSHLSDLRVTELPVVPYFGKGYYGGQTVYKDAHFKLVWNNRASKLNGTDITVDETVGLVATKAEADEYIAWSRQAHPDRQLVIEETRELRKLLNESTGTSAMNTYMKKKSDRTMHGKIKGDAPIDAPTLPQSEVMKRDLHSIPYDSLTESIKYNEARFVHQYGHLFKEEYRGYFPETLKGIWDDNAFRKAGVYDKAVQMKDSAQYIHWNIMTNKSELTDEGMRKMRARMADMARTMGASDNMAAQVASKSLLNLAQTKPMQRLKGVTSSMAISLGFGFQVPQNLLSAFGLSTMQGLKGMHGLTDPAWLIPALRNRGKSASEYEASVGNLAWKLGTTPEIADEYVKRVRSSGILGNAGAVDNLLRYVSDMVNVDKGFADKVGGWVSKPVTKPIQMGSDIVAKSIDMSMLWYYSIAFRKKRMHYQEIGKEIGGDDFWEEVRHLARAFGQNQNRSDMLSYERSDHPLSFHMQFMQHVHKVGFEASGNALKATTAPLPKQLQYKGKTHYSDTTYEAARFGIMYALMFGAGGGGSWGVSQMHDLLPDNIANPTTESEKMIHAFMLGGMIDLMFQSINWAVYGGETGKDVWTVSSKISGGGMVDFAKDYYMALKSLLVNHELPVDLLETLGGAGLNTMTGVGDVIFNSLPAIANDETLDAWEKGLEGIEELAFLGKTFSDAHIAWMAAETGKFVSKRSGNLISDTSLWGAIGKAWGIETTAVTLRNANYAEAHFDKNYWEKISKKVMDKLRKDANENVFPYPDDRERYVDWLNRRDRLLNNLVARGAPKHHRDRVKATLHNFYLDMLNDDSGFARRIRNSEYEGKDIGEVLEEFTRDPSVSDDNKAKVSGALERMREAVDELSDDEKNAVNPNLVRDPALRAYLDQAGLGDIREMKRVFGANFDTDLIKNMSLKEFKDFIHQSGLKAKR